MEIKDQKIIDTLAETLGVPKENLSGVRILSKEEQAKEIALLINTYFKENFLKRVDDEMNRAAKLKDSSNHLLMTLSELRQKCLEIKEDSPQMGILFGLAEQLGAVGYAIFVADKIELNPKIVSRLHQLKDLGLDPEQFLFEAETLIEADWINFINSKTK
jgi:hypothetical protein